MKATPSTIGNNYHVTNLVVTITPLPHKKSTVWGALSLIFMCSALF